MNHAYSYAGEHGSWGLFQRIDLALRDIMAQGIVSPTTTKRPTIPPVLACGLCLWASCGVTYLGLRSAGFYFSCLAFALALLASFACSTAILRRLGPLMRMCMILGICVGIAVGGMGAAVLHARMDTVADSTIQITSIEMLDDARLGTYGSYGQANAYDSCGHVYRVRVLIDSSEKNDLPLFGEIFAVSGQLEPIEGDYSESSWESGLCATLSVTNVVLADRQDVFGAVVALRKQAIASIQASSGSDEAKAVLAALVCGYRVDLYDTSVYDSFKVAGLAHLVAVSGAHLSLVSMMLAALLSALRLSRRLSTTLQSLLVIGFLVFAGLPISAIRAAVMTFAGLFSFLAKRRASSLNALGLCIMALVMLEPSTSVSVSFVLSALSVLGIALFSPLFTGWLANFRYPVIRKVGESVAVTMSASILSTPYSACLFNQLPLVSPLANLLAAPLFTVVCSLGVVGAVSATIAPTLGSAVLGIAVATCDVLCQCVKTVASMPYASIPFVGSVPIALVLITLVSLLLWVKWPQLRTAGVAVVALVAAACVAGCLFVAPTTAKTQIVALDVGQGDAILLRDGSLAVLVDTGNQDQKLLAALARQGIYHLDAIIITHGDDDHMGSLDALEGIVAVDRVVVCEFAYDCTCDHCQKLIRCASSLVGESQIVGVKAGDELSFGSYRLQVVWPTSFVDEGGNADSLCMVARADVDADGETDAAALLCGDAEDSQLDDMIESGALEHVDIYKVGHHGSRKAIDADTARILSPQIALVSVGEGNSYGHPASVTLDALRSAGTAIYRTDQQGDLICSIEANEIKVTTQK